MAYYPRICVPEYPDASNAHLAACRLRSLADGLLPGAWHSRAQTRRGGSLVGTGACVSCRNHPKDFARVAAPPPWTNRTACCEATEIVHGTCDHDILYQIGCN